MAKSSKSKRASDGAGDGLAARTLGMFIAFGGQHFIARILLMALISLVIFLPGLTELPPTDRDEARFAQASRQMLETGDFVDIQFQDEDRHKKPAGIYWAQAAAATLAGGPEAGIWAYRLPSLIGAVLAVLLTAWATRPLVGSRAAFLAALMMAGALLLNVEARIAKTDALLLASIVAAQGALARLWFQVKDDPVEHGWNVFFFWTALAIGALVKGPIILLPVGATLLWMMLYERSVKGLGRLGIAWGLVWMLLIAAPWYVAIGVKTDGGFFMASLGEDMLQKVTQGKEAHGAPPGYYFGAFWLTFWPWTALALIALPWVWRWRASPEVAFLLGWIAPTWLVFEIVTTKLPHYVLPIYPAIAAIAAAAALDGAAEARGWLFRIGAFLWAIPALALPAAVAFAPLIIAGEFVWPAIALCSLGFAVLLAAWRWLLKGVWVGFVRAALIGSGLVYAAAFHFALPALEAPWISGRLAGLAEPYRACLAEELGARPPIASVRYHEPSLVFLAGTDTKLVSPSDAGAWLARTPGALVWVQTDAVKLEDKLLNGADYAERPEAAAFNAALASLGATPELLAQTEGFNYNRGRLAHFALYGRAGDAAIARCRAARSGPGSAEGSADGGADGGLQGSRS